MNGDEQLLRGARVRSQGFEASDERVDPLDALLSIAYGAQEISLTIEIMNRACRQIEELSSKPHPLAETIGVLRGGAVTHSGPTRSGESVVAMNRLRSPKDDGDPGVRRSGCISPGAKSDIVRFLNEHADV